ncbi:MAG TPA: Wzz/FepE/Etk N-terminal domain-containing protein [Solirubrobacteraceae bacterium]|nr:Wzz/FepE/Etk N-terminal domain-containing protein [Solirubrobacteraceae bacterium]
MNRQELLTPLDYLRAVRERWRLVALVVALCAGIAFAVSLSSEKQYDASAQLLLRGQDPIDTLFDPTGSAASRDPERALNTEVELITIGPTAQRVRRQLGLDRTPDELLEQVEVKTSSTSDIVELQVRDPDPVMAARIANGFADAYVQYRVESASERYREAADLVHRQLLALPPAQRRTAEGLELQARRRDLQIAAEQKTGGAQVVRRASIPESASRPRPKLAAAIGIVLGLLLGIGLALVLSFVDRRMKDEDEVERSFGLPILGGIPRPARRAETFDDPAQREAYGLLAANRRLAGVGEATSVIMITSPSPGDGKTSVTIGVARAYARLGLSVVVIEADLRRPAFGRYTDVSLSAGLTGILAGGSVASELLWLDADTLRPSQRDTSIGGAIGILPAGDVPPNPQRTLSDPRMRLIVDAARAMADVVLIDSAPVGTVNDAAVLAPLVEGIVLVARLNQTTKDAARRAIRTVRNLDVDALGVVVTDAAAGELYYASNSPPATTVPAAPSRSRGS